MRILTNLEPQNSSTWMSHQHVKCPFSDYSYYLNILPFITNAIIRYVSPDPFPLVLEAVYFSRVGKMFATRNIQKSTALFSKFSPTVDSNIPLIGISLWSFWMTWFCFQSRTDGLGTIWWLTFNSLIFYAIASMLSTMLVHIDKLPQ